MKLDPPLVKEAGEEFPFSIDFKNEVVSPETISSATFTATKDSDNSDVTSTLRNALTPTIAGTIVTQPIKAGSHGLTYTLKLAIITSASPPAKWSGEITLVVRDIPAPIV